MSPRSLAYCLIALGFASAPATAQDMVPPKRIEVLPIFFVPRGEDGPTAEQSNRLVQHLEMARTRYRELLPNKITFAIADEKPRVYHSKNGLEFLRKQDEGAAPQIVSELLTEYKRTRFNCPYILLTVVVNAKDEFPVGGGRPLNGGFNTGGGIIQVSTFAFDRLPNFQSTLQHELGHSFGLPHVDVYGRDMKTNGSLMSYNPEHHTKGLVASKTPGKLNPEEVWGLSLNQRAFPGLQFNPKKDVPPRYALAPRLIPLGPMKIPDHAGVSVTTESGEEFGSKVGNIVQGPIKENLKTGKVTYDAGTMWSSAKSSSGWVSVKLTVPYEVELTGLEIHSQHSGQYHAAKAVRVSVRDPQGKFVEVTKAQLKSTDEKVKVAKTKGKVWLLEFQAGESGIVVIRGLRFFSGDEELLPPLVPLKP